MTVGVSSLGSPLIQWDLISWLFPNTNMLEDVVYCLMCPIADCSGLFEFIFAIIFLLGKIWDVVVLSSFLILIDASRILFTNRLGYLSCRLWFYSCERQYTFPMCWEETFRMRHYWRYYKQMLSSTIAQATRNVKTWTMSQCVLSFHI